MNKSTLVILLSLSTLAISSCKKSSSGTAQSIVGTWKFSGISGTSANYTDSSDGNTTTYSYSSGAITSTFVSTTNGVTSTPSTSGISVTTESWVLNGDGTYTINEVYDNGGGFPITAASSGTWYYLNGSKPNDGFELVGQTSQVLYDIGITSTIYNIQSVGGTLVLTITNSESTSMGSKNSNNITLSFTQ